LENSEAEIEKLLGELGLLSQDSKISLENRVNELNMRQLDRLKLMLERADKRKDLFSERTRTGIRGNDLSCFAEAVLALNEFLK
jgi:hypothetical protein